MDVWDNQHFAQIRRLKKISIGAYKSEKRMDGHGD